VKSRTSLTPILLFERGGDPPGGLHIATPDRPTKFNYSKTAQKLRRECPPLASDAGARPRSIDAEYDAFMAALIRAAADHAARLRARFAKISERMRALYADPDYRARMTAKRTDGLVRK
jgi:hypothetical protein